MGREARRRRERREVEGDRPGRGAGRPVSAVEMGWAIPQHSVTRRQLAQLRSDVADEDDALPVAFFYDRGVMRELLADGSVRVVKR